jgi:hypothetical protein
LVGVSGLVLGRNDHVGVDRKVERRNDIHNLNRGLWRYSRRRGGEPEGAELTVGVAVDGCADGARLDGADVVHRVDCLRMLVHTCTYNPTTPAPAAYTPGTANADSAPVQQSVLSVSKLDIRG